MSKESIAAILSAIIIFIVVVSLWSLCGVVIAWLLQISWNAVMPALFGLPVIDFWQACAVYFLLSLVIMLLRALFGKRGSS